ncbi:hypothetical protein [Nocardia asiatica]|nr:hypothetical protein [Nocardia asiatica]
MRPPLADPDPTSWLGLLADLARVVFVLLLGIAVFVNVTIGWPL